MEIKRRRGVARRGGDGAQAGAVQPLGFEDAPGGRQNQAALQLADRLLPSLAAGRSWDFLAHLTKI